ncbi:hypothetical protein [Nesterenkonia xinjiangensis]|uniref:Uncharacterized protein n=1 Tax=Nesterenkonia xinjiangensis TaxID=225327 RepID=A0A7Z0K987_9MICC|nr:hypothetical protein [Nesterenkonia xinjiangensis]NYJ78484.1 hypothetical protein [Nesterenkonia xinjiangensis]
MDFEILAEKSARTPSTAVLLHQAEGTRPSRRHWPSAAAVALIAPLLLMGCAADTGDDDRPAEADGDEATSEPAEDPSPDDDNPHDDGDASEDGAQDVESQDGADDSQEAITRDGLPDPETTLDVERTEELGAFFSEEEACMTVGSTVDGLRDDMENGLETEQDADGAYEAVEQTYLLVPEDLRAPFESIASLLEADHDAVDTESVLTELEPLDTWMLETCDGQYHQQDSPEHEEDADASAADDGEG